MYRNIFIAAAYLLSMLFASASMGATASQPNQPVLEDQAIEYARDDSGRKSQPLRITGKQAQAAEAGESVDCYYQFNRSHPDCSSTKPVQR
jgi:hypothetical protein